MLRFSAVAVKEGGEALEFRRLEVRVMAFWVVKAVAEEQAVAEGLTKAYPQVKAKTTMVMTTTTTKIATAKV